MHTNQMAMLSIKHIKKSSADWLKGSPTTPTTAYKDGIVFEYQFGFILSTDLTAYANDVPDDLTHLLGTLYQQEIFWVMLDSMHDTEPTLPVYGD